MRTARNRHVAERGQLRGRDGAQEVRHLSASTLHVATTRPDLEILDRVGGGDSFASGLIYGLLTGRPVQNALEYGAANGALAMTTPGDTSMATLAEVAALVRGASARVQR